MIEVVAKAIFDADPIRDKSMAIARKKARAAIEAMREPTEAMEKAAMLRPDESYAWRREWQLAIDAALTQKQS